ncbi:uncharacterized protein LOC113305134 [Papaver somniferum]|uniref:uncharacterized protein LOC113305134 n=1 Tax=Papaver somniferum TaxID=3469 RepID=UPI000E6F9E9C|nr:uncharacterized protein LOC113305134 [Papaver somniferum]
MDMGNGRPSTPIDNSHHTSYSKLCNVFTYICESKFVRALKTKVVMDVVRMDDVSCIVVVRYFSDFITMRGNEFPLDCYYSLQALISITNSKKKTSADIFLQNVTHVASSSSSREDSSIYNGFSTSSSRNNRTVAMYLEDKNKPTKPLLSDGWPKVIGEVSHVFVEGVKKVRIAFTKYLLRTGFNMVVTHNECSRFTSKCADSKCGWKFHAASIDERNKMFQARSYNPEHICGAGGRNLNKKYSISFTSSLIEDEVRKNPHKNPRQIAANFHTNYGITMEYYQAYNCREKVYETIYGEDVKSYSHLVWYIDAIRETNSGSVIKFEFDPARKQFQRIFIALVACIKGYRFCRPMVYLDATFLTGRFRGCLMAATGINGGFFPLAAALVDSENVNNWEWFLSNLTEVVGDGRPITFLSDCHEGILQGVPLVYPESFHNLCYYHLMTNMPITGLDPSTLAESLNSCLVVHKKMPASALLNQIGKKIMCLMAKHREIGANTMTPLTPEYEENLEDIQDEGCVTCSYNRHMCNWKIHIMWRVYGFSCAHALASIRKIKRQAIDFI